MYKIRITEETPKKIVAERVGEHQNKHGCVGGYVKGGSNVYYAVLAAVFKNPRLWIGVI